MYITQIQSRLRSVFDEETRRFNLVPTNSWQTLDELDEGDFDEDIEHLLNHHISIAANQMNITEEECKKNFRLKEIIREEEDEE
jgi:hypothetical protein